MERSPKKNLPINWRALPLVAFSGENESLKLCNLEKQLSAHINSSPPGPLRTAGLRTHLRASNLRRRQMLHHSNRKSRTTRRVIVSYIVGQVRHVLPHCHTHTCHMETITPLEASLVHVFRVILASIYATQQPMTRTILGPCRSVMQNWRHRPSIAKLK